MASDYLSPGWVDYSKKLPLVKYDVTSLIKDKNAIGFVLGDGWATGHIGSNYTFKRDRMDGGEIFYLALSYIYFLSLRYSMLVLVKFRKCFIHLL